MRAGLVLLVVGSFPVAAAADRRAFTHVYEYQTMAEGGLDLELWNTQSRAKADMANASYELKIETEYGISDHWDVALYQVFAQGADAATAPFAYAATQIETRYRFAERGEWPVDTLGYFEVAKSLNGKELELEAKGIFAKDFGSLNVAANLVAELLIADETTFIPGWALGVSYEVQPSLKIGAEAFGELSEERDALGDRQVLSAVGPSVSWAPAPRFWIAANVAFGLTDATSGLIAQFVIGIGI